MTTDEPTNQDAPESCDPFNLPPRNQGEMLVMRAEALRKTIRHLLPHLRGAFLVGTSVSASEREWSSFQLTSSDSDNLMLSVMLPSEIARWTRALLTGELELNSICTSMARGGPKGVDDNDEFYRGIQSAITEINEFFERWILVGHFVTEFDCIEPMVYAHRPTGEDLVDFLRPAIFAMNYACATYLKQYGFTQNRSIMEVTHEHVEDLIDLYPDPEPEDAAEYLRRLLLQTEKFDPEEAVDLVKWMPGLGETPVE